MTTIHSASLEAGERQVAVTFVLDDPPAYNETLLWSLFARDDQGRQRQFGYKQIEDFLVQFVFDHNAARQTEARLSSSLLDNVLIVRFNLADATGLNLDAIVEAHAVLTVDGQDVSRFDLDLPNR